MNMQTSEQPNRAYIAAEHLVGNLWFNLDTLPLIAGLLEPDTMRFAVGGEAAMAYSEMCRLMQSQNERLSAGALEAGLKQQGFDFGWLTKLQSRIEYESIEVLHNYAAEVNNAADLRRVQVYCAEASKAAVQPDARADAVTGDLLAKLSTNANKTAASIQHVSSVTGEIRSDLQAIEDGTAEWGASTGFPSLDKIFTLMDGDMLTIAGRPSQGKSSLARQIVFNRARDLVRAREDGQVVIFTADDTPKKTVTGLAAAIAGVDINRIRQRVATAEEKNRYAKALDTLDAMPIMVDGMSNPTADSLYYRCAMLNAQKRIRLAMVDYMQLIKDDKAHSELQEAQRAASGCKGVGHTLKFPMLVLSQLTKGVENRADKWPTPSDLMYSGEAESDVCMLVMRPEHYISRGESIDCEERDREGVALINIGKNKQGDIGMVRLQFTKEYSRFGELAE
jgi:replicative DNA helicase